MKRTLLLFGIFASSLTFAQDCSDLFISEYVEGKFNNKALEIYNPTDATVDLSQYFIARYNNGSTAHTSTQTNSIAIELVGTLAPKDVHVGVIDKNNPNGTGQEAPVWPDLVAQADEFYCPVYGDSYAFYFNGNDALILYKGDVNDIPNAQIIDIFGKIGDAQMSTQNGWSTEFPYNTGGGVVVTKDHSLIRKSNVLKGETNLTISFFDPLAEYDSISAPDSIGGQLIGDWNSLGEHACDCNNLSTNEVSLDNVTLFPNPTANGTFIVKGIENAEKIEVFSTLGESVYAAAINGSIATVDLGEMKGLYLVRFYGSNGVATTRRVILK